MHSTQASKSGHPTSCASMAEIMSVLFFDTMRYSLKEPRHPASDRLVLTEGSVWEAMAFASNYSETVSLQHNLDIYDALAKAFSFETIVVDDLAVASLVEAFKHLLQSKVVQQEPLLKLTKEKVIIHCFPDIEDKDNWHGKPLGDKADYVIKHLEGQLKNLSAAIQPFNPVAPEISLKVSLNEPPKMFRLFSSLPGFRHTPFISLVINCIAMLIIHYESFLNCAMSQVNIKCVGPNVSIGDDGTISNENARACNGKIVVVEDHYPEGGLGEAVAGAISNSTGITMKHLAVREIPRSGPPADLIEKYGFGSNSIINAVKSFAEFLLFHKV
uniref:transketolase n=1 Tax=Tetranychus urticae TaxID=32264 RepID=T1JS90_TETUR